MPEERQSHARYPFIRGDQTLWNGDPVVSGAKYRDVKITSNEISSVHGTFQVYCLEATSKGIVEKRLSVPGPFRIIFDGEFEGFANAEKKFSELVKDAEGQHFHRVSAIEQMEFQAKTAK
jgi:hypothetical protein